MSRHLQGSLLRIFFIRISPDNAASLAPTPPNGEQNTLYRTEHAPLPRLISSACSPYFPGIRQSYAPHVHVIGGCTALTPDCYPMSSAVYVTVRQSQCSMVTDPQRTAAVAFLEWLLQLSSLAGALGSGCRFLSSSRAAHPYALLPFLSTTFPLFFCIYFFSEKVSSFFMFLSTPPWKCCQICHCVAWGTFRSPAAVRCQWQFPGGVIINVLIPLRFPVGAICHPGCSFGMCHSLYPDMQPPESFTSSCHCLGVGTAAPYGGFKYLGG